MSSTIHGVSLGNNFLRELSTFYSFKVTKEMWQLSNGSEGCCSEKKNLLNKHFYFKVIMLQSEFAISGSS